MNVIGSRPDGWWKDRGAAMVRLTRQLEQWATAENQRVTVVFEKPPSPPISSEVVGIAAAPRAGADSADDEIVRLIRADERPHDITVATSDAALVDRVTAAGAASCPASRFRDIIEPAAGG